VPYLFDTDAVSEVFKPRPNLVYLSWLATIPRREQFTSAIVIGEIFAGAFGNRQTDRHLVNLRERLLPRITVLPFDVAAAEAYGRIRAALTASGELIEDADMQIAATAIAHGMSLVTGNVQHHGRIPGLDLCRALADAREEASKRPASDPKK
jgi:tRNA(fMet)-specific endonuclease VapC